MGDLAKDLQNNPHQYNDEQLLNKFGFGTVMPQGKYDCDDWIALADAMKTSIKEGSPERKHLEGAISVSSDKALQAANLDMDAAIAKQSNGLTKNESDHMASGLESLRSVLKANHPNDPLMQAKTINYATENALMYASAVLNERMNPVATGREIDAAIGQANGPSIGN